MTTDPRKCAVRSRQADLSTILGYDVSRWGRFADVDESACHDPVRSGAGIRVPDRGAPFENDGGIGSDLLNTVKRVMTGPGSRALSVKVAAGRRPRVDQALFLRARERVDARSRHVSDEEPLDARRVILERQGGLSERIVAGMTRDGGRFDTLDLLCVLPGPGRTAKAATPTAGSATRSG